MEWGQRWRWDLFLLDVSLHRGPDEEGKVLEKIGRRHRKMQVPNDGQSPIKSSSCLNGLVSQRRGKIIPAGSSAQLRPWSECCCLSCDCLANLRMVIIVMVLMMDHHWWCCCWWWWCITSGWQWSGQEKVGDDFLNISRWQQSFYCSHINPFSVHKLHILIF